MRQYAKYLQPFVDTFCWCLLPNHFHFLVRVKQEAEVVAYLQGLLFKSRKSFERKFLTGELLLEELLEQEWKRFFTAYAMAFNKQYGRKKTCFTAHSSGWRWTRKAISHRP